MFPHQNYKKLLKHISPPKKHTNQPTIPDHLLTLAGTVSTEGRPRNASSWEPVSAWSSRHRTPPFLQPRLQLVAELSIRHISHLHMCIARFMSSYVRRIRYQKRGSDDISVGSRWWRTKNTCVKVSQSPSRCAMVWSRFRAVFHTWTNLYYCPRHRRDAYQGAMHRMDTKL